MRPVLSRTNVPFDPQRPGILAAVGPRRGRDSAVWRPDPGGVRTGRYAPGEKPTSPTPASAPPRAHPDPGPHRTLQRGLVNPVRPVSVPDNARRYGPVGCFRGPYSGNGAKRAGGRQPTAGAFTARCAHRSRCRGAHVRSRLAMRSRVALLPACVVEGSLRSPSLRADRDSRERSETRPERASRGGRTATEGTREAASRRSAGKRL